MVSGEKDSSSNLIQMKPTLFLNNNSSEESVTIALPSKDI